MPDVIFLLVSTIVMYLLYYLTLYILDKKVHGLARKKNRISSRLVYAIGALMVIAWIAISLTHTSMALSQRILNMCIIESLAVLAVSDWKKHIIPNCILVPILIIWAAVTGMSIFMDATNGSALFFSSLVGGFLGGLIFLVCYLLAHGRLGAGDVKLVFVMGLCLTEQKILGAILVGMVLCCVYMVLHKNGTPKGGVPLAPFLFLGTLTILLI